MNLSFKDFLCSEEKLSGLPNAARVNLGITDLAKALPGAYPSVNAQLLLPTYNGGKIQVASAPTDYEVSKDGKKAKMKIMGKLSPYIFYDKMDLFKPKNLNVNLSLEPDLIDKLMFQGMPLPSTQPSTGAPAT